MAVIAGITTTAHAAFFYMLIFSAQLLLILALRKSLRLWLGARYAYWLWALPLVWLPFHLWGKKLGALWASLQVSFNQLFTSTNTATQASTTQDGFVLVSRDFFTDISSPLTVDFSNTNESGVSVLLVLSVIWLFGLVLLAGIQYTRLHIFRKYLKTHSVPAPHPEVISPGTPCLALRAMDGPAVFGILKPTLLIPEDYFQRFDANQRHLMMAHEQVHLQRRDNLWNLLAEAIRIVFWFNPLVHIAYSCYRLDQELSCDARALEQCNDEQQKKFARTLLETSACIAPTPPFALTAWDNLNELKERSTMINNHLKQKRRPVASLLVATAIIFGGSVTTSILAQNTRADEPGNYVTGVIKFSSSDEDSGLINTLETSRMIGEFKSQGNIAAARDLLSGFHTNLENGELSSTEALYLWRVEADLDTVEGLYVAAIDDLTKALPFENTDTSKAFLLRSLASHYQAIGELEPAIDALQQAYDLQSDGYSSVLYQLANLSSQLGNTDAALEYANLYRFEIFLTDIKEENHQDYYQIYNLYKTINAEEEGEQIGSVLSRFYQANTSQSVFNKLQ